MTLQACGLSYARGRRQLFTGLDFEVGAGEALRVAGRNGSGKTSLLGLLCGLADPQHGEVRWQGRAIRRQRDVFHRDLLYILRPENIIPTHGGMRQLGSLKDLAVNDLGYKPEKVHILANGQRLRLA